MSLTIWVKSPQAQGSRRFVPHFNRATDRYYHTKEDYVKDLAARGLVPSTGQEPPTPSLALTPSRWARDMYATIRQGRQPDGTVRVGERFHQALEQRGVSLRHPKVSPYLP